MNTDNNINARKQCIYVELDCLLDTRLGTLSLLGDTVVEAALENNYFTREEDTFPLVNKDLFKKLYDTRDKELIKISPRTHCVEYLNEIIFKLLEMCTKTPIGTGVSLFINIYPYKLNEKEITELIEVYIDMTKGLCDIVLIDKSLDELTPMFCKNRFNIMFMYYYSDWLEIHSKNNNFRKVLLNEIKVYGPKVYFNRKPNEYEKRKLDRSNTDPFKLVEKMASVLIDLELLDPIIFSADFVKVLEA